MDDRPPTADTPPPLPPAPMAVPDRGSPGAARLALVVLLACFGLTVFFQQRAANAPEPAPTPGIQAPGPDDLGAFVCKVMLKLGRAMAPAGGSKDPAADRLLLQNIDAAVALPEEQLRGATVVAELVGADPATQRLTKLKDELSDPGKFRRWPDLPDPDRQTLIQDSERIAAVYAGSPLTPEEAKSLTDRHGFFGRLVSTWGKPDTDTERAQLLGGAGGIVAFLLAVAAGGVVVLLASLACAIAALILLSTRRIRPRFVPPAPGGSVYLETVAAFFMGFVALKIAHELIDQTKVVTGTAAVVLLLGLQWALAIVILWPVARGVPFQTWQKQVGLHLGEGLVKEAFCGVGAYLAGLPIVFIALLVSSQLMQHFGGPGGAARNNPILESVSHGGWLVFLIGTLATIWAPLVEETIFRGSLFRHLRGFLGLLPSAILSAVVFGGAHGYQWFALGPVVALGFNFALIRAWRGSLVGPILMHALNNATVLTLVFCLFQIMKD